MRSVASVLCVFMLAACSRMSTTSSLPATGVPATTTSNFQTIFIFRSNHAGIIPVGSLLVVGGDLYGTTNFGGTAAKVCNPGHGCGVVYDISTPGQENVVYRFKAVKGGARPYDGLIDVNGTLYGTTQIGGTKNDGVVFAITPSGSESVLYDFHGKDGNDPRASLTSVNGVLYGTTYYGGTAGIGTVFSVSAAGSEKVLHSFTGGSDGSLPLDALTSANSGSLLYGTTSSGGANNAGTVFEIGTGGSNYQVIYNFKGGKTDGAVPYDGLTEWNGTFYGTTQKGGKYNQGTVFSLTPSGSETVLHSFGAAGDGAEPFAGLTVFEGALYGTTSAGGAKKDGTIYSITASGSETVVHSFTGSPGGRVPYSNLTAMGYSLYGTTVWGGRNGAGVGTAFEFTP